MAFMQNPTFIFDHSVVAVLPRVAPLTDAMGVARVTSVVVGALSVVVVGIVVFRSGYAETGEEVPQPQRKAVTEAEGLPSGSTMKTNITAAGMSVL